MSDNGTAAQQRATSNSRDNDGLHKRRGIWHYELKICGRWRELSTGTTNYQEAKQARKKAEQDQDAGRLPNDFAKWPFSKAADHWLESRESRVAEKTYKTERELLNTLMKTFGDRKLAEITAGDIQFYQATRIQTVSPKTVNLECSVLRMARLWARMSEDYKPFPKCKSGPGRALSPEEEQRLFDVASSRPRWEAAYYAALLAANTTARKCEVRGLRLSDVNLLNKTISVRRSTTKTDAGTRTIPLNETASRAVARLLGRASMLGASEPDHYLFPAFRFKHTRDASAAGAGFDPTRPMQTWRTAWRKLTRAAGLAGFRFHDLRHHCITRLAEAGTPEQTLMAIAGHISREMLEHYSHIRMQAKRTAVAALDIPNPVTHPSEPARVN
jgi:integrase